MGKNQRLGCQRSDRAEEDVKLKDNRMIHAIIWVQQEYPGVIYRNGMDPGTVCL